MSQAAEAYRRYSILRQQGVPEYEAYQRSGYGNVIRRLQSQRQQQVEERRRLQASQAGRAGRQQLGGQLAGALALKAGYNYLMDKPLFGETGAAIGNRLGIESELLGSTGGTPTPATAPAAAAPAPIPIDINAPMSTMPTDTGGMSTVADGGMSQATDVPTETGDGSSYGLGNALTGALGAYNIYQGAQQFKKGNKLEGAIGAYTGAGQLASSFGQSLPGAGALGAAYGAYQLGKLALNDDITKAETGSAAAQGAAAGAAVGSVIPGIGTAIGALIGGTIGAIKGLSGSGKGQMQIIRDKWRDAMIENDVGLFDPETYKGTLPDGTKFNWGKDRFGFGNEEAKGDINLKENPVHGQAASYGNLMTTLMGMGQNKANESIAAQYTLASLADNEGSTANATDQQVRDRFRYFMDKNEFSLADAQQQIGLMLEQGKIDQEYHDIQQNNLRMLMNDELMEQEAATQGVQ